MKLYAILNKNDNKLLRYSTHLQAESNYSYTDPVTKNKIDIHEICIPNVEYSSDYLGKTYNIETGTFED